MEQHVLSSALRNTQCSQLDCTKGQTKCNAEKTGGSLLPAVDLWGFCCRGFSTRSSSFGSAPPGCAAMFGLRGEQLTE